MGWPRATAPPLTLTRSAGSVGDLVDHERHDREGLVDLVEVDVVRGQALLLQGLLGWHRRGRS
jgi:hypothetical protein